MIHGQLKSFSKHIREGDNILIALSGGGDSICLTYLLFSLKEKLSLRLSLCHFNHCLRENSDCDVAFIKELAEKLQLPLYIGRWENPKKSQRLARTARYDFFLKIAKEINANKIALGHNLDDNVETILFHIIRGEGPYSIPEKREDNGITIIRPLLKYEKKEIEAYLLENNIPFLTDKTNKEPIYLRNKIRLKLIPILLELNPKFKNAILKLSRIFKRNLSFLEEGERNNIAHPAILANVLRKNGLSFSEIEKIIKDAFPCELEESKDFYYALSIPSVISVNDIKIEAKITSLPLSFKTPKDIALFDYSLLRAPLFIRNIKHGDRFIPYGCNYQKKVARFLIAQKVPRTLRKQIPILCDKGGILWIVGQRRSNRAILTPKTKDVLMVRTF